MSPESIDRLIKQGFRQSGQPLAWADLGCGGGAFTMDMAKLLPSGSTIYAIDRSPQVFQKMINNVEVIFRQADFEKDVLQLPVLDGMLMANALHYVKDKILFLGKIKKHLAASGHLLIIEYNTETPNQWVPYPVSFNKLKQVVLQAGFSSVEKMEEVASSYNNSNIYSCIIKD